MKPSAYNLERTQAIELIQSEENNLNSLTIMADRGQRISIDKSTEAPDERMLGLHSYPESVALRRDENTRLDDINKNLPENSFSSTMLKDMQSLGLDNVDIWYGSNVQLNGLDGQAGDGGALYRKWSQLPGIYPRESSHAHKGQEYQIKTGLRNSALLFGVTPEGNTFFQIEHNFAGSDEHGRDYELYRELKQNIGAEGISPHTDKDPIIARSPLSG